MIENNTTTKRTIGFLGAIGIGVGAIVGGILALDAIQRKRHIEVPESKRLAPDMEHIALAAFQYYAINEDQLYFTQRAVFNEASRGAKERL